MGVLIPKTKKEIWLNRVRVLLPPLLFVAVVAARCPEWHLWGLPLVVAGEALRTWAAGHLLKDEQLTVGGPYAYVRNPLYVGSLLSTAGLLVIVGDWGLAAVIAVIAFGVYLPTVLQEEGYLKRMHGEAFEEYRRAVPGIIPRLTPARLTSEGIRESRFEWRWVRLNKEHRTWLALAVVLGLLLARRWWPG